MFRRPKRLLESANLDTEHWYIESPPVLVTSAIQIVRPLFIWILLSIEEFSFLVFVYFPRFLTYPLNRVQVVSEHNKIHL